MAFEIMEHKWVRTLKCRSTNVWQTANYTWLKLNERNPAQDILCPLSLWEILMCSVLFSEKGGVLSLVLLWQVVLSVGNWTMFQQTCIPVPALSQTTCPGFWELNCLGSSPLDTSAFTFMWSTSAFGNNGVLISLHFSLFHVKKGNTCS